MDPARRLPPLTALRALEAIREAGSVTGAARRLNVSHSAISHQMKLLEASASLPLFHRRGRATLLTAAGESLAAVTHRSFEAIRHEMDRLPLRHTRPVSLATLPIVASQWLAPAMADLVACQPELRLHLSLAMIDRPNHPPPDIVILFGRTDRLHADEVPLISGEAVPVCAPELLVRFDGHRQRLLETGPLIHDDGLRMWDTWRRRAGIGRAHMAEDSRLVIEGSGLLHSAALSGAGVSLCRIDLIRDDLASSRLVALSSVTIDEDWTYYIKAEPTRALDKEVAEVVRWLRERAKRHACGTLSQ